MPGIESMSSYNKPRAGNTQYNTKAGLQLLKKTRLRVQFPTLLARSLR
jgi:hypothetical protein